MTPAHRQRILTALILMPLLAAAVLVGGLPLRLAVSAVTALALGEYLAMFWDLRRRPLATAAAIAAGVGLVWIPPTWPEIFTMPLVAMVLGMAFLLRSQHENAGRDLAVTLAGLVYIPLLLRPGLDLAPLDLGFVLLATISTDTVAFYTGTHLGGPKLWPRISPKKTWSGSLGGLGACVAVCTLYAVWIGNAPWAQAAGVAGIVSVAAQMGDLIESALKRWRGVKDSGNILPGHGGILDRIDSLLTALPVYAAVSTFFPLWP